MTTAGIINKIAVARLRRDAHSSVPALVELKHRGQTMASPRARSFAAAMTKNRAPVREQYGNSNGGSSTNALLESRIRASVKLDSPACSPMPAAGIFARKSAGLRSAAGTPFTTPRSACLNRGGFHSAGANHSGLGSERRDAQHRAEFLPRTPPARGSNGDSGSNITHRRRGSWRKPVLVEQHDIFAAADAHIESQRRSVGGALGGSGGSASDGLHGWVDDGGWRSNDTPQGQRSRRRATVPKGSFGEATPGGSSERGTLATTQRAHPSPAFSPASPHDDGELAALISSPAAARIQAASREALRAAQALLGVEQTSQSDQPTSIHLVPSEPLQVRTGNGAHTNSPGSGGRLRKVAIDAMRVRAALQQWDATTVDSDAESDGPQLHLLPQIAPS
eukprot:SAG11_NODE_2163_length_3728_cov_19.144944_4_plen_393_part_00